uniref:Uncharacterized protein n=1 Tax=Moschus moschiferus TaxID=68415 RepID=A0A8C6DIG1_MOSMO
PTGGGLKGQNGAMPSEATKKDHSLQRAGPEPALFLPTRSLHDPLFHHALLLWDPPLLHGTLLWPVCKSGLPGALKVQPQVQRCGLQHDGGVHIHRHLLQRGCLHRLLLLLLVREARVALYLLQ